MALSIAMALSTPMVFWSPMPAVGWPKARIYMSGRPWAVRQANGRNRGVDGRLSNIKLSHPRRGCRRGRRASAGVPHEHSPAPAAIRHSTSSQSCTRQGRCKQHGRERNEPGQSDLGEVLVQANLIAVLELGRHALEEALVQQQGLLRRVEQLALRVLGADIGLLLGA